MKKILIALLTFCAALQVPALYAQTDQRTLTTKIADLLAKVPSEKEALLQINMDAIAAMGEQGIEAMALMLQPPGKGDNTRLEYALGGYSYYTTQHR